MMPTDVRRALDLAVADECRLNVLRLHGCAAGERALEVEVAGLSLHAALRACYRHVDRCGSLANRAGNAADGCYDLITIYGRSPAPTEVSEARRMLRPGGIALFAMRNRWWYGRRAPPDETVRAQAPHRMKAAARDAGFTDLRCYWVEPSLAVPRNQIPAIAQRVRHFEGWRSQDAERGAMRAFAVAAGLHAVLYPAALFVALR